MKSINIRFRSKTMCVVIFSSVTVSRCVLKVVSKKWSRFAFEEHNSVDRVARGVVVALNYRLKKKEKKSKGKKDFLVYSVYRLEKEKEKYAG